MVLDELADLGSKDAAMQTRGVWGIEVSELDAMNRGEVSRIKAFITRTTDRFRPPYGSRIIESPRSCVFWGTTNADGYLKDETGGRRFWPVKIGKINVDLLRDMRDQLWAEAVVHVQGQVPWWITKPETIGTPRAISRIAISAIPGTRRSRTTLSTSTEVSVDEVLRWLCTWKSDAADNLRMTRAASCLRSLGCHGFRSGLVPNGSANTEDR